MREVCMSKGVKVFQYFAELLNNDFTCVYYSIVNYLPRKRLSPLVNLKSALGVVLGSRGSELARLRR